MLFKKKNKIKTKKKKSHYRLEKADAGMTCLGDSRGRYSDTKTVSLG